MIATMPRPKIEREQVNLRMGKDLLDRLDRLGLPYGQTRTSMIIQAVAEWVQRQEQARGIQPDHPAKRKR